MIAMPTVGLCTQSWLLGRPVMHESYDSNAMNRGPDN